MQRTTKLLFALGIAAAVVAACDPAGSSLTTAPPASLALSESPSNPDGYPPDDWVYQSPDPDFKKYDCTFALGSNAQRLPDTACKETQWGKSGIYRQQIRKVYAIPLGYNIDVIRLCNHAWPTQPTPYGSYGPNGCVVISVVPSA